MSTVRVGRINEAKAYVESDDRGAVLELAEGLTFYAEGYKFMPAFRNKMWDGKIRLLDRRDSTLPMGLVPNIADMCTTLGYDFELIDDLGQLRTCEDITSNEPADIRAFFDKIKYKAGAIVARDYQIASVIHAIENKKSILVSPTGSGKSLMIWMMINWYLAHAEPDYKIVVIVPTTSLVEQMYKDFADYSPEINIDKYAHRIYSGKDKVNFTQRIVITTWQSAIKMPRQWFAKFGMVIGDEAHTFKAKSLTTIMDNLVNAEFRVGTTGTLDGIAVHELQLTGCFGPPLRVVTTAKLIENDTLAKLKIDFLIFKHPEIVCKAVKRLAYHDEIDFLVTNEKRNRMIRDLAIACKGNTLILYNYVEKHGKPLYDMIVKKVGSTRDVHYVSGAVKTEERENIRAWAETSEDCIITASMGTFSTGINIRNIHNIIFASPTKSQIRVLQSIGRGLRKSDNGQDTRVFDICDDMRSGSKANYAYLHGKRRHEIYMKEGFPVKVREIEIQSI